MKLFIYTLAAMGGFILFRRFRSNLDWKRFSSSLVKPQEVAE